MDWGIMLEFIWELESRDILWLGEACSHIFLCCSFSLLSVFLICRAPPFDTTRINWCFHWELLQQANNQSINLLLPPHAAYRASLTHRCHVVNSHHYPSKKEDIISTENGYIDISVNNWNMQQQKKSPKAWAILWDYAISSVSNNALFKIQLRFCSILTLKSYGNANTEI